MSPPLLDASVEGILLVNKPQGRTSFSLVAALRRILGIRKIGHAGTLDPLATGVMVLLIGKKYTVRSEQFIGCDKEYEARIQLGITTNTFDTEGVITNRSDVIPSLEQIENILSRFQGEIEQIPPMFSAKKVQGKKLYDLARKGKEILRPPARVTINLRLNRYDYPFIDITVSCSKGTYIRSLAHDIGSFLGCGACLSSLQRTRSGVFSLSDCIDGSLLSSPTLDRNWLCAQIQRA